MDEVAVYLSAVDAQQILGNYEDINLGSSYNFNLSTNSIVNDNVTGFHELLEFPADIPIMITVFQLLKR